MTLRQFFDSIWFKALRWGLATAVTAIIVPLMVYGAATLTDVRSQQLVTASDLVEVQAVQAARAEDGENFQGEMRGKVVVLTQAFGTLDNKVDAISQDVALIKGILMRNEAVASR